MSTARGKASAIAAILILLLIPTQHTVSEAQAANLCVGAISGCYPTISAALTAASSGSTINVDPGTYHENVLISTSVHLAGVTQSLVSITPLETAPVLTSTAPNATVSGLTITGGTAGGVLNQSGSLTLDHVKVSGNLGGGIINRARLQIVESTITGNTSDNGGGLLNDGIATIATSTFSANHAVSTSPTFPQSIAVNGSRCASGLSFLSTSRTCYLSGDDPSYTFGCGPAVGRAPFSSTPPSANNTGPAGNASSDLTGTGATPGLVPGCYQVRASVRDLTRGGPANIITSVNCGGTVVGTEGANSFDCSSVSSPICPVGAIVDQSVLPPTCSNVDSPPLNGSQVVLQVNDSEPSLFAVTFTGYTPTLRTGRCPTGLTFVPGPFTVEEVAQGAEHLLVVNEGVCQFTITNYDARLLPSPAVGLGAWPYGGAGGGIFNAADGTLTGTGTTIASNTAAFAGGGLLNHGTFNLNGVSITGGSAVIGAGVFAQDQSASLTNTTVSSNAGTIAGGFFAENENVTIAASQFQSNNASRQLGGLGLIYSNSSMADSSVLSNFSGGAGAGLLLFFGSTVADHSVFGANTAVGAGGGIEDQGALTLNTSTIGDNRAQTGAGIFVQGGSSSANLQNVTVSANDASVSGGGLDNQGTITALNSIIAGDRAPIAADCTGADPVSSGYVLAGPGCGIGIDSNHDLSAPPLLGPLQNNSGPTLTMAPLTGSPALDAGPLACPISEDLNMVIVTYSTDQRGLQRPQGVACDIGAYELDQVTPALSGPPPTSAAPTVTFIFSGDGFGTFQCQVDGSAFQPCTSPDTIANTALLTMDRHTLPAAHQRSRFRPLLAPGTHTFSVREVDAGGNPSPHAASWTWQTASAPAQSPTSTPFTQLPPMSQPTLPPANTPAPTSMPLPTIAPTATPLPTNIPIATATLTPSAPLPATASITAPPSATVTTTPAPTATPGPRPQPTPSPGIPHPPSVPTRTATPVTYHLAAIIDGHPEIGWESNSGAIRNLRITLSLGHARLWRIHDILLDPAATDGGSPSDALRRFQILVSTSGRQQEDFHMVFAGACRDVAAFQHFYLHGEIPARYLQLHAINNFGGHRLAIAELEVFGFAMPAHRSFTDEFIPLAGTNGKGHHRTSTTAPKAKVKATPVSSRAAHPAHKPAVIGVIRYIRRGLTVTPPRAKTVRGRVKMSLYNLSQLQTGRQQSAYLNFHDGTSILLNQLTTAQLVSTSLTRLHAGQVDELVAPGTNHRIQTASATASAIGTNYIVIVHGRITTIEVLEGAVRVAGSSPKQKTVLVKTGQQTTVTPGRSPTPPKPIATQALKAAAWTRSIPAPPVPLNVALDANGGTIIRGPS